MAGIETVIQNSETREIYTIQTHESHDPSFNSPEGEIIVRGHCIMKGYWNKHAETQAAIDHGGWFHTGDVSCFQPGNLKINYRIKNMIVNASGKNISPTTVENGKARTNNNQQNFLKCHKRENRTD